MIRYFKRILYPSKEKQIESSAEAIISKIGLSNLSDTEKASVFIRTNQKFDLRLEDKIKRLKQELIISKQAKELINNNLTR